MNPSQLKIMLAMIVVVVVSASVGYWLAQRNVQPMNASGAATTRTTDKDRKALYWYDPMVPNQHFDTPGKSPFMDMQLVPKYANEAGQNAAASSAIQIDPGVLQNLGIRLTTVQRGRVAQPIEAAGNIVFNQRDMAIVQTRAMGFVARVYRRALGDVIVRNAPLVDLLVPEWAGAQAEFLSLLRSGDPALISAARQRLVLLGMPAELIATIEADRQQQSTITVRAPISGMIDSLEVHAGMSLSSGATLAKINGLNTVWLEAQIPEAQSGLVSIGKQVKANLAAYAGETLTGKVIAVLPEANVETRTVRVRVELPNPQQRLRPGMFAHVQLDAGDAQPMLFVPSEAVIRSGRRNVVIAALGNAHFEPVEVQLGAEANGKIIVLAGLNEGQQVVASGQFLIDSEASLQGVLTRLSQSNTSAAMTSSTATLHEASGKIESLSASQVVISHGPIPSLSWGAMTMSFKIDRAELIQDFKAGDVVKFEFAQQGDRYVLEHLQKLGSTP